MHEATLKCVSHVCSQLAPVEGGVSLQPVHLKRYQQSVHGCDTKTFVSPVDFGSLSWLTANTGLQINALELGICHR